MIKIIQFKVGDDISFPQGIVLCLGYFDGVHIGHASLIGEAVATSQPVGVLTLDRAPKAFINHEETKSLTSTYDKAELLGGLGVKYLFVLRFNEATSYMTKDEFIHQVIDKINPTHIFVGEDYHFGFKGQGDANYLTMFYPTTICPLLVSEGEKVSSRSIMNKISDGDIDVATALLGRYYSVSGLVVEGLGNGNKNGVPTANVDLDYQYVLPPQGVYATYTVIGEKRKKSVTCISTHPTIQELDKAIIETYVFDFKDNLYGRTISVEFVKRLRDIRTFPSLEDLKEQILIDEEAAKKCLQ
ncbi:MAG: riboflavin biosynthesis protein RibF [Coprobacillus sp.]|nr:riboflavin biosynthesis protein RibF [Coprobacillus sp.]